MEEAARKEREAATALEGGQARARELAAQQEQLREAEERDAQEAQVGSRRLQ